MWCTPESFKKKVLTTSTIFNWFFQFSLLNISIWNYSFNFVWFVVEFLVVHFCWLNIYFSTDDKKHETVTRNAIFTMLTKLRNVDVSNQKVVWCEFPAAIWWMKCVATIALILMMMAGVVASINWPTMKKDAIYLALEDKNTL